MTGLCHFCLVSGIQVRPIKGEIRCLDCIDKVKPTKAAIAAKILPFEDLPEISEEQRGKEHFIRTQKAMDKAFEDKKQR